MVWALVGTAALAAVAGAEPPLAELEQMLIESADTPKEHAALAQYFAKRAGQMREEAGRHRRMGRTYGGQESIIRRLELKAHCDELATLDEAMAEQYDALAALHSAEATGHQL
jgi:hypothetical protein